MSASPDDKDKVWDKAIDIYGSHAYKSNNYPNHNEKPSSETIAEYYADKDKLTDTEKNELLQKWSNKSHKRKLIADYKKDKYIDEKIRPHMKKYKKPAKYASMGTTAALGATAAYYTAKKLGYIGGKRRKTLRRKTHRRKKNEMINFYI